MSSENAIKFEGSEEYPNEGGLGQEKIRNIYRKIAHNSR